MKCSAIKLSHRVEQTRRRTLKENATPAFAGEGSHSYSFPFLRTKAGKLVKPTSLAITTINLPDNIQCFNTGASLDRWSKKRTRLKSAKIPKTPTEFDKEFCYENLETEISILLNDSPRSADGSLHNLEYEVHTDIEKLLQESERNAECEDNKEQKRRRKKRSKDKKKVKTIKFSKPSSPQTEQVIRVDLTSNVSANEDKRRNSEISKIEKEEKNEMTDDKRKELIRNLNERGLEMCDDEFIVKCKQLALRQRRKRRL